MVSLSHYLILGALLFAISIIGIFLNRKNVIILLMAIELMLLAVNLNFIAFSHYLHDIAGQVFVFFIPVSYTHLDVYKRQIYPRITCRCNFTREYGL